MAPVTTREYVVPSTVTTGPLLQAVVNDPTKCPDGTRLILPENRVYPADRGLDLSGRKHLLVEANGSILKTDVDAPWAFTVTDAIVAADGQHISSASNPFRRLRGTVYAWYVTGDGMPAGARTGAAQYIDDGHIALVSTYHATPGPTELRISSPQDRTRYMLTLVDCEHVAVNELGIDGPNEPGGRLGEFDAAFEAQHGVMIGGGTDLTLDRPRIHNVFGDFVALARSPKTARLARYVNLMSLDCWSNGRMGISINGAADVLVDRPNLRDMRRSGIDIEPNSDASTCRRIKVRGPGRIVGHRFAWLAANDYDGADADVGDLDVDGITVGAWAFGISPGPSSRWGPIRIANVVGTNPSGNPTGFASTIERCDAVVVTGNRMLLQSGRGMRGLRTIDCTGEVVNGNDYADGVGEWRNL